MSSNRSSLMIDCILNLRPVIHLDVLMEMFTTMELDLLDLGICAENGIRFEKRMVKMGSVLDIG